MKVLVTGATGFVGHHLCRALVKRGYHVTALHRRTSDLGLLAGLDLNLATGDITDVPSLESAARGQGAIIHAAGLAGALGSRQPARQNQANIEGTRNIVAACFRQGVRRLIFISSVAAIGIPDRGQAPADETFAFNLTNTPLNYPISKKRGEDLVIAGCRNGLDAVIVNPATMLGEWGLRYRGSEWLEKIRHRPVAFYFTGGCNLVHVSDVVDGILCALERGRSGERYILGGENLTFFEIASLVARSLGKKIPLVPIYPVITGLFAMIDSATGVTGWRLPISADTHFIASRFQYYSSAKANHEFGYTYRPFSEIVKEIQNWYDRRLSSVA